MEVNSIKFRHPSFTYIVGKSETGKTYFINEFVKVALKNKFKIVYLVNSAFDVEPEIEKLVEKNKNVFVIKSKDLSQRTIDFLIQSFKSKDKKIVIADNFTFSLTLAWLDFVTFARKYNCSTVFIGHSLFASKTISPRLREVVSYFIFFYLPFIKNLRIVMDEDLLEVYQKEVGFRTFKFLLIDQTNGTWLVSKLPEFKIEIVWDKEKKKEGEKKKLTQFGEEDRF